MFGYVQPVKEELRVREFTLYRGYYCGLCKALQSRYGFLARMFLNYDFVLPAMLADSLAGESATVCMQRCPVHPLHKRGICAATNGLNTAADALVLTCYYKIEDDLHDEKLLRRFGAWLLHLYFKSKRKKAAARLPGLDEVLAQQTKAQQGLEARQSHSADEASDPTGAMTAAVFTACAPKSAHSAVLQRMGMFMGRTLYLLDAADDFEKDAKSGSYNVLSYSSQTQAAAAEEAQSLCRMYAGEIDLCYNLLPLQCNKEILDNIIFLGLPRSIALAGKPQAKNKK